MSTHPPSPTTRAALGAGLIATLAACGGPPPDTLTPRPERATVALTEPEVRAVAQIIRLEDERRYDAAIFERLIDGGVEVRRRAAVAAGRIGDSAAVTLLVRLLGDDPDPSVRADAAFALGELGDTSRVAIESLRAAVPTDWVPSRAEETQVVVETVHALGKLGTFEARALVIDALRSAHPGRSENARRVAAEALLALWRFEAGPGRVFAAGRYLDVPDPELRWRAAYALMRIGEPDAVTRLVPLVAADADHRVRANGARLLTATLADSAGARDTALAVLTAALGDGHPHVRINAVRALGGYGDEAPVDAMAGLLDDPEPHVVIAAAGSLSEHADRAGERLAHVLGDPARPPAVHAAVGAALAAAHPDDVLAAARRWADGPFEARYAAARTLAALDSARAVGPLRGLATDTDRRVAVAAVRAIESMVDSTEAGRLRAAAGLDGADTAAARPERDAAFYEEIARAYVAGPLAGGARPRALIRTAGGEIEIELLAEEAPLTVHNFVTLARGAFWDGGVWHRVIPNFVLQDGAPAGDPGGGPGWRIRDEINRVRYARGMLGMALSGPDTGGSQWFITHSPQHHLDGGYTIFGRVVDGMDVADRVLQGDAIISIRIRE